MNWLGIIVSLAVIVVGLTLPLTNRLTPPAKRTSRQRVLASAAMLILLGSGILANSLGFNRPWVLALPLAASVIAVWLIVQRIRAGPRAR
jgi:hypothetical protein